MTSIVQKAGQPSGDQGGSGVDLYYARKRAVHAAKRVLGLKFVPDRYKPMYADIVRLEPKSILEIGTNDGLNAVRMMRLATAANSQARYFGFDMFEKLDEGRFRREFALRVPSKTRVADHLRRNGIRNFRLYAGDSQVTLAQTELPLMDFIFIDGGHSQETVASDWRNCQRLMHERTIVYFDDYPNWGIGTVVDGIDRAHYDVEIMPEFDEFAVNPEFGRAAASKRRFQLARVRPGGRP